MRRRLCASLVAVLLAACTEAGPATAPPAPSVAPAESEGSELARLLHRLRAADDRATLLADLAKLVETWLVAPDEHRADLREFVATAIPTLLAIWDRLPPADQILALDMLREVAAPEAAPLWIRSLVSDGQELAAARMLSALAGIRAARAAAAEDAVIEALQRLVADPTADRVEVTVERLNIDGKPALDRSLEDGTLRAALCNTLGALRSPKAVPALLDALQRTAPAHPPVVQRAAIRALGAIRDPSAIDPLLIAVFRVPDTPSTGDVANLVSRALARIGEPAVPGLDDMVEGRPSVVVATALEIGVDLETVRLTGASFLGAIGTHSAALAVHRAFSRRGCVSKLRRPLDPTDSDYDDTIRLRAVVADALGKIGDPVAVEALCACRHASHDPGDTAFIVEALGRIGGDEAFWCLTDLVASGEYRPGTVGSGDTPRRLRWEAARALILAASPERLPALQHVLKDSAKRSGPTVRDELARLDAGAALLGACADDKDCYLRTLGDPQADRFAREKAAFEVARLAPGDASAALAIARAFAIRSPAARVSMALLVPRVLRGEPCQDCAAALEQVLSDEKGAMDVSMVPAVLAARLAIARVAE